MRTDNSADEAAYATGETAQHLLVEGEDYYSEGAAIIFTARYHLRRGYCCDNRCRHCPYGGEDEGLKPRLTIETDRAG